MTNRARWLMAFTALCIVAAFLAPSIPQPPAYHHFADRRSVFGIANFFDVASNGGFLFAGIAGLVIVFSGRAPFEFVQERWPWAVFFLGILLTAFGSSYYHLAPDNERLFWDRLPMTIAFAGLIASQLVDRISMRIGLALLVPLLAVFERSRYTRAGDIYWIFGWYVLSKLFETFDQQIYAFTNVVSGHTLKHLAAWASGFVACFMLMRRTLRASAGAATLGPNP